MSPTETVQADEARDHGHAVVVHESPAPPAAPGADATMELLRLAIEKGVPVETLERLQALHERVSDRHARAEFAQAVARFQSSCPPIAKTSTASIATKSGVRYSYQYAELDQIARTIAPHLRDVGLSYTWDSEIRDKLLVCRCTLRHVSGHAETASFTAPVESPAGMTEQQKVAAALTYARRQSLIQVLGLTTCDPDHDGATLQKITEQQAADLEALIDELKVDRARFLQWAEVDRLEDILVANYESAVRTIRNVAERRDAAKRQAERAAS